MLPFLSGKSWGLFGLLNSTASFHTFLVGAGRKLLVLVYRRYLISLTSSKAGNIVSKIQKNWCFPRKLEITKLIPEASCVSNETTLWYVFREDPLWKKASDCHMFFYSPRCEFSKQVVPVKAWYLCRFHGGRQKSDQLTWITDCFAVAMIQFLRGEYAFMQNALLAIRLTGTVPVSFWCIRTIDFSLGTWRANLSWFVL